ncbi:HGxxPAAW family protein [Kitasatospora herbaricolor]|uniref:HGxxPAAW family protein n=1 Tax=Kitasatospora herbaricolor TaxID=68217 RepID=UPI0036D93BA0
MSAHGDHDMGHTVAGWTGSALTIAGTTVMGLAFVAGSPIGVGAGGTVLVLAALTTWLLHLAGWGKPTGPRPAAGRRDWRTRDTAARLGHRDCLGCRLAGRRPPTRLVPRPHGEPSPVPAATGAGPDSPPRSPRAARADAR